MHYIVDVISAFEIEQPCRLANSTVLNCFLFRCPKVLKKSSGQFFFATRSACIEVDLIIENKLHYMTAVLCLILIIRISLVSVVHGPFLSFSCFKVCMS